MANEIIARHFADGRGVRVSWGNGVITAVEEVTEAPEEWWVAPGLVDLQVNGFGGVDFQQDNLGLEELLEATQKLQQAGCGRYLLTLITDEWPRMMARLRSLRRLRSQSETLRKAIVGWHIEGPFLSPEPGFCGAHDASKMSDPTVEQMGELRQITERDPVLLTLAPERANAMEAIAGAVALGMKVNLGHTNASLEIIRKAVAAGATGFTHLANGCPRLLDRHDNILWRVFEAGGLVTGIIPDKIHVSPALFRLIHKVIGPENIYYITDAMAAAGAKPGRYRLGRLELEVGEDQIVRQPGQTNFAGSALRPIDGVFRAAKMLGCSWREVWPRFSEIPARYMGLEAGLGVGQAANFCVLEVGQNGVRVMTNDQAPTKAQIPMTAADSWWRRILCPI